LGGSEDLRKTRRWLGGRGNVNWDAVYGSYNHLRGRNCEKKHKKRRKGEETRKVNMGLNPWDDGCAFFGA